MNVPAEAIAPLKARLETLRAQHAELTTVAARIRSTDAITELEKLIQRLENPNARSA
jgi:type II secretory pathway component PulM